MDMSVITAASALAGAAIGGFTSLVAAWFSHRVQAKEERLAHYQLRRQELYKEFIEQASELYIHALQSDKPRDKQNANLVLINSGQQRRPNR
jgi:hypothetical protein